MENIIIARDWTIAAARFSFKAAKVAVICAIVFTSLVGSYVLVHRELRNQTIDFAQGQTQVEAPKGN